MLIDSLNAVSAFLFSLPFTVFRVPSLPCLRRTISFFRRSRAEVHGSQNIFSGFYGSKNSHPLCTLPAKSSSWPMSLGSKWQFPMHEKQFLRVCGNMSEAGLATDYNCKKAIRCAAPINIWGINFFKRAWKIDASYVCSARYASWAFLLIFTILSPASFVVAYALNKNCFVHLEKFHLQTTKRARMPEWATYIADAQTCWTRAGSGEELLRTHELSLLSQDEKNLYVLLRSGREGPKTFLVT